MSHGNAVGFFVYRGRVMKKKKPILASKFLIKAGITFYGKRYFSKRVKLIDEGVLSQLKAPFVVVANHASFADVAGMVMMLYPNCASFVISETQIIKWPKLINRFGVLPKKQFTVDTSLIRDIKYVLSKNRPVVIYPEAKLSADGRQSIIKPAVAKLIKMLKVPLVTVRFNGNYLHKPRWAKTKRFLPMTADVQLAVTADEAKTISAEEIHSRIIANLACDDYAYQLANNIHIDTPDLAEGLEHLLYKCPVCNEEFAMTSKGNTLTCTKCGLQVVQNTLGQLEGCRFDKVTDWVDWQRDCCRQEVLQEGYRTQKWFVAEQLDGKKYVEIGPAELVHDHTGVTLTIGENVEFFKKGVLYTLSFDNDHLYFATEKAIYRLVRQDQVGSTFKLNLLVEEQCK